MVSFYMDGENPVSAKSPFFDRFQIIFDADKRWFSAGHFGKLPGIAGAGRDDGLAAGPFGALVSPPVV